MKSLEIKLLDEISRDQLENIVGDFSEVMLDSFMNDGILKDIPIVGTIVGFIKVSHHVREKIFAKKILKFLYALKDIPLQQRIDFINRLEEEGFKQKVGETLIVLLDQLDNLDKPTIIGNLFNAYILQKINYQEYTAIASSVNRISIENLQLMERYHHEGKTLPTIIKENLAFNGLMSISIQDKPITADMTNIHQSIEYNINSAGRKLLEFGFIK